MWEKLIAQMPAVAGYSEQEHIQKGYSSEAKFRLNLNGEDLLLRLTTADNLAQKQAELRVMQEVYETGARCPRPIGVGLAGEGHCYLLVSYLEGIDCEEGLPLLSEDEQYEVGWQAGADLRRMHTVQAPPELIPWGERRRAKHERYLARYLEMRESRLPQDEKIISFVEQRLSLMQGRPDVFAHDDFHPGNLIMQGNQYVGAIDFNRYDWGDPIHEFYKTALFSRNVSIPFSIGMIKAYCRGERVPDYFWELYSLYVAIGVFADVVWAAKQGGVQVELSYARLQTILEDHKYFELVKPIWFVD